MPAIRALSVRRRSSGRWKTKGSAVDMMRRYVTAFSVICGSSSKRRMTGRAKTNSSPPQHTAISSAMLMLCEAKARASSRFCAPMDWPTLTSDPTLFSRAIEPDIHVRMPTAPTAATASLPRRPTHAISVRLYAIWMKDVAMMGIARPNSWRLIGPWVRFFAPCMVSGGL